MDQPVFVALAVYQGSTGPSIGGVFDKPEVAMEALGKMTPTKLEFEHYRNQWFARSNDGRDLFIVSEEMVRS